MSQPGIDQSWLDERPEPVRPSHIPRTEASPSLPTVQRRLAPVTIWTGGVLALAGLATGAFLLSEAGLVTLGFEHLWGLSNRPAEALSAGGYGLVGSGRFVVDGTFDVTFASVPRLPTIGGESQPVQPSGAGARLQSRLVLQQIQTPTVSQVRLSHDVTSSSGGDRPPLFGPSGPGQLTLMSADETLYLQLPEASETAWVSVKQAELATVSLQAVDWAELFERLSSSIQSGKRLAGRTIDGQRAKGYQVTVAAAPLLQSLSPSLSAVPGTVDLKVWIETSTARPLLLELVGSLGGTELAGSVVFRRFDDPALVVTPPSPSSVTVQPLTDWLQIHHILAGATALGRDAERKRELAALQTALEEHATAQSPFAYPKVDSDASLGAGNTVSTSDLADELKPYLDPLPTDPQSPDRSYAYSSDGTTYRLTAVLERAEDPEGTKDGDQTLYAITP